MTEVTSNKHDLLTKLCGILAGWMVFLITFFLIAISFALTDETLNIYSRFEGFISLVVVVILMVSAISAGVYAGLRFGKYFIKLLKTKSNKTVIILLIALILLVIISFPSFFIYTEF